MSLTICCPNGILISSSKPAPSPGDAGKKPEKKASHPAAGEDAGKKADERNAREQQLKLLNDEASGVRKNIQRGRRQNQPVHQVEKDW